MVELKEVMGLFLLFLGNYGIVVEVLLCFFSFYNGEFLVKGFWGKRE